MPWSFRLRTASAGSAAFDRSFSHVICTIATELACRNSGIASDRARDATQLPSQATAILSHLNSGTVTQGSNNNGQTESASWRERGGQSGSTSAVGVSIKK